jgi:transcriptional regulator with PAS, ATPase and Fis domain
MIRDACNRIPQDLLSALMENPHESQIVVDAGGIIRYVSVHTEIFYKLPPKEMIGKHILEMNPESKLPRVLATGKAEIGRVIIMGGKERIVARIPLRDENGQIVGAVGKLMFWHLKQLKELIRQVEVLETRLNYYEKELKQVYSNRYALDQVVGQSPAMQEAKQVATQAAESDLAVLITGETGTGKEVFAHAIHQMSAREGKPFVKVNCAAIPQDLFESELFGYEAGAFTGASQKGKPGKFELADGGTIFLDEVGDLPLPLQVKLLRVIQEQEVERLGGTRTLKLDFRVVAATNRDLKEMMQKHAYRQDLYYRLNIFRLRTPALREIPEDIPRIAYHILSSLRQEERTKVNRISPAAMERMAVYNWPGNVRELRNVIERAAAVARRGAIGQEHLPVDLLEGTAATAETGQGLRPLPLREEMAMAERRVIEKALSFTGGNRTQAARLLGIHRTGLHQKLRAHGLN